MTESIFLFVIAYLIGWLLVCDIWDVKHKEASNKESLKAYLIIFFAWIFILIMLPFKRWM